MKDNEVFKHDLLNAQTGRIAWAELARYFARGLVVTVERGEDLLKVAETLIDDAAGEVKAKSEEGLLRRARDEDAMRWQANDTEFWAFVVAHLVLVQEI